MHLNIFEDLSKPSPNNSDLEAFKFKSNSIVRDGLLGSLVQTPPLKNEDLIHIENQRNVESTDKLLKREIVIKMKH